jgi:adenine-specific DNA-methyltransferase
MIQAATPIPEQTRGLAPNVPPHLVKYMGSKRRLIDYVAWGIDQVRKGDLVCDLFSGSGAIAGALGRQTRVHANDIQQYGAVLAKALLTDHLGPDAPSAAELVEQAKTLVESRPLPRSALFDFNRIDTVTAFIAAEEKQRTLIDQPFDHRFHLFTRNYAGTWWSAEQCAWIDALREVAETHRNESWYNLALAAILFAMSYCGQGTGHYAQYRDVKNPDNMADIRLYRRRSITDYFTRKFDELTAWAEPPAFEHEVSTLPFEQCLERLEPCTVYADPPYCFVHYSRFYHAMETLVLYDYPPIQVRKGRRVKGRYRDDRHQSPFCIRSQVTGAFTRLFDGVSASNSSLVLSYCNTGMISLDDLYTLAKEQLPGYAIDIEKQGFTHMTMGRKNDRSRDVTEVLLLASR